MNKKLIAGVCTLSGSIIGAGILGLPYVFSKAGFLLSAFYLIIFGLIMMLIYLYLGEVALRVKTNHQLPGYAEKFLGKRGKKIMILTMFFAVHSSLLAYLIGEGESLSTLFFGNIKYALFFTLLFWGVLSLLLKGGMKELKKIESYGVIGIILIILVTFFVFGWNVEPINLLSYEPSNIFLPIGVIIFAFLGFTTIPELKMELSSNPKLLKKAIILGVSIPMFLYLLFTFTIVGLFGVSLSEIVTLTQGLGPFVNLLGIFTMLTSYFVLSFSIYDMYLYDLKFKEKTAYFLSVLVPLGIYLLVTLFGITSFISVIGFAGVFSGGFMGILSIVMNYKSKKAISEGRKIAHLNKKTAYSIPINKIIVVAISLMFIVAIVLQLFF